MNNYPLTHAPALLREMRQTAGLSQSELGRRIGRDQRSISRHEQPGHGFDAATTQAVADACGFDVTFTAEKRP